MVFRLVDAMVDNVASDLAPRNCRPLRCGIPPRRHPSRHEAPRAPDPRSPGCDMALRRTHSLPLHRPRRRCEEPGGKVEAMSRSRLAPRDEHGNPGVPAIMARRCGGYFRGSESSSVELRFSGPRRQPRRHQRLAARDRVRGLHARLSVHSPRRRHHKPGGATAERA